MASFIETEKLYLSGFADILMSNNPEQLFAKKRTFRVFDFFKRFFLSLFFIEYFFQHFVLKQSLEENSCVQVNKSLRFL